MSRPLQIREVPDEVLQVLRVRAAEEGQSLSAYVRRLLEEHASRPTVREIMNRARSGASRATREDVLQAIADGRREQDEKLDRALVRRGR